MIIAGIDAGINGAIAIIVEDKTLLYKMPTKKLGKYTFIDSRRAYQILRENGVNRVALEKQYLDSKQQGNITIAGNYYKLLEVCLTIDENMVEVMARTWQGAFPLVPNRVKRTKTHHIKYVMKHDKENTRLFLNKKGEIIKSRDGFADAWLIAHYLRKMEKFKTRS